MFLGIPGESGEVFTKKSCVTVFLSRTPDVCFCLSFPEFYEQRIAYNSCITACGRGQQWELALKLLQQMPSVGVTPDIISYNAAMAACGQVSSSCMYYLRSILQFSFCAAIFPVLQVLDSRFGVLGKCGA